MVTCERGSVFPPLERRLLSVCAAAALGGAPNTQPLNMFAAPAAPAGGATGEDGQLSFLRGNPQFQALLGMVQVASSSLSFLLVIAEQGALTWQRRRDSRFVFARFV